LLKALGHYNEGLIRSNKLIKNEESIEEIFLEANIQFVYGEYEKAIDGYNNFLQDYPLDTDALYNKGLSKILLRKTTDGCTDIEQSLSLEKNEKRSKLFDMFCSNI